MWIWIETIVLHMFPSFGEVGMYSRYPAHHILSDTLEAHMVRVLHRNSNFFSSGKMIDGSSSGFKVMERFCWYVLLRKQDKRHGFLAVEHGKSPFMDVPQSPVRRKHAQSHWISSKHFSRHCIYFYLIFYLHCQVGNEDNWNAMA